MLSDADGDSQSRLQNFLDIANPGIERSRANFDLTHMIKADGYYELPFGKGHKLSYRRLDRVIGGWTFGSTMTWQSGAPFSILSERGTLNRESRSYYNTADTSLTRSQLNSVVKFQMTGNGPMMIAQSAINATNGTGVNADGDSGLQRADLLQSRRGDAGRAAAADVQRSVDLQHGHAIEEDDSHHRSEEGGTAMDAFNALNHATFWSGDQNINSTTFGVISSMFYRAARGAVRSTLHFLMPPLWNCFRAPGSTTWRSRISRACRTSRRILRFFSA